MTEFEGDPNTPDGFRFLTNVSPSYSEIRDSETGKVILKATTGDDVIAEIKKAYGEGNVVVTEPAYNMSGNPFDGRAVHVRGERKA